MYFTLSASQLACFVHHDRIQAQKVSKVLYLDHKYSLTEYVKSSKIIKKMILEMHR